MLGVHRDDSTDDKKILNKPHLSDLNHAEGTVVIEFGPVRITWKKEKENLYSQISLPEGIKTTLVLPHKEDRQTIELNDKKTQGIKIGN